MDVKTAISVMERGRSSRSLSFHSIVSLWVIFFILISLKIMTKDMHNLIPSNGNLLFCLQSKSDISPEVINRRYSSHVIIDSNGREGVAEAQVHSCVSTMPSEISLCRIDASGGGGVAHHTLSASQRRQN